MLPRKCLAGLVLLLLCVGLPITHGELWNPPIPRGQKKISALEFPGYPKLTDDIIDTLVEIPQGKFPHIIGKLHNQYKITSMQLVLREKNAQMLNKPFNIYFYNKHLSLCFDKKFGSEWVLCKKGVKLTKRDQLVSVTCDNPNTVGQFIVITSGTMDKLDAVTNGFTISDIALYGEKVGPPSITSTPDPRPYHKYDYPRKSVFLDVEHFVYNPSYAQFKWTPESDDVVLLWANGKPTAMYGSRGKGQFLIILGDEWVKEHLSAPYESKFADNVRYFLSEEGCAYFIGADEPYETDDIIVVNRKTSFDVQKVKNDVMSGTNGVVISFKGSPEKNPQDSTWKLIRELNISIELTDNKYNDQIINGKDFIGRSDYVPEGYDLEWRLSSWSGLCERPPIVDCQNLPQKDRKTVENPKFQENLRNMLKRYQQYFHDRAPCEKYPHVWEAEERKCWRHYNLYAMCQMGKDPVMLPGYEFFPGKMAPDRKPGQHRVKITPPRSGNYNPTGVYVSAGETFKWKVLDHSSDINDYGFMFGCTIDDLSGVNQWKRWPILHHGQQLTPEGEYAPPFGGVLFVKTRKRGISLTLELDGVYRHPWFDLRNKSSIDRWDEERENYKGTPYMAYTGDYIVNCLQTGPISKLKKEDMIFGLEFEDNNIKIMHNVRGSDWKTAGMEVFATDIQIPHGHGHSGVPFIGLLSSVGLLTDIGHMKTNGAGLITHELGHNMQNFAVTFERGMEVTNNVYIGFVRQHLLNITGFHFGPPWGPVDDFIRDFGGAWISTKYVGVTERYYTWLAVLFGEGLLVNQWRHGWEKQSRLKTESDKVNSWIQNLCKETEQNVVPWHELWHFPITDETRQFCKQYRCFVPDDKVSQGLQEHITSVLAKVPEGCDRTPKKQVESRYDIRVGLWETGPSWVELL